MSLAIAGTFCSENNHDSLKQITLNENMLMMIHGGGTTPPTMTSSHGRSPGRVTVIDYHYFVVLRVAIDYWLVRPLVRFLVYDFCFLRCLRVFGLWLSWALFP